MKLKPSYSVVRTNEEELEEQITQPSYSNACREARKIKAKHPDKGVFVLVEFSAETADE